MGFKSINTSTKLWIFIVLVILGIVSVAVVGLVRSASILGEGRVAQSLATEMVQITTEWNGMTETNAARNQAIILSGEPGVTAAFKDAVTATSNQISELQKKMDAMPLTEADKAQLQKIAALRKTVIETRDKVRLMKTDGKADEAMKMMNGTYLPAMGSYLAAQKEMIKMQQQRALDIQVDTEARRMANTYGILVGLAVIVSIIFLGTAWLVRSIREPLAQANELAARIAQGDLSSEVHTERHDEFGMLLRSLADMNGSLSRMVSQVRQSTDSIAIASAEIATGNNDLAQRTEQTSSNLQAAASNMDSLTGMVQHSADNARQASTLAASASTVAQRGGTVVTQVVTTMQEIDASSKKIADIISVIDGIAFQTNILALNAAVEAARAGEQGRGFAVVASEVRSLAGRSAEAAREIKGLISTSVAKVESGTQLVTDAGATMEEIVQSVQRVVDVISEITAAASEQSSGIAGVNTAIGDLDQMTQQNAALVEESAAAAESLREQADRMKQAVAVFKVAGGGHGATPALGHG
ncbi:methyl-accepting chemotaxis protein [Rhodoferax saidenbachensis]|uniref:Methyl-accepting chemotaxis protein n=1 Tax=Rhodoferax saidenbachensis TaxID=1484693 RepID=A0A1P8KBH7_9BURK|nr:methyl-accepting chemotaxis protein [Rhodoferax saidenbachensis]APW43372.1 methyl-accepting chemotaxis protein [Rhodoferax saidenbachensis]